MQEIKIFTSQEGIDEWDRRINSLRLVDAGLGMQVYCPTNFIYAGKAPEFTASDFMFRVVKPNYQRFKRILCKRKNTSLV